MATMETTYYALLAALTVYSIYRISRIGHRPKDYPPGPSTLPVLGNIHLVCPSLAHSTSYAQSITDGNQMANEKPHLQFQKWAQEYGGVYSLILGTKTMIVLSSDQAVKDLLDKKSANYSARPDLYTGQTLLSGGKRMVMMVCSTR